MNRQDHLFHNPEPLPLSEDEDLEPEFQWPAVPADVAADVQLPHVEFAPHTGVVTAECNDLLIRLRAHIRSNSELQPVMMVAQQLIEERLTYDRGISTKERANESERETRKMRRLAASHKELTHTVSTIGAAVEAMDPNAIRAGRLIDNFMRRQNNSVVFDRQSPLIPVPFADMYGDPTAEEAAELGTVESVMGLSDERLEYFARRYNRLLVGDTPFVRKARILNALGVQFAEIQQQRASEAKVNNSVVLDSHEVLSPVPFADMYGDPTAEEAAELGTVESVMGLSDERLEYFARRYNRLLVGDTPFVRKARILNALGVQFAEIQQQRASEAKVNNSVVLDSHEVLSPVPFADMYGDPTAEEAAELGTWESIMGLSDERLEYFARRYHCFVAGDRSFARKIRTLNALGVSNDNVTTYLSQQSRALNWVVNLRRNENLSPVANLEGEFPHGNMQINLASTAAVDGLDAAGLDDILNFYSVRALDQTKKSKRIAIYRCLGCDVRPIDKF